MSFPLDFAHYALEFSDGNRSNKFYNATLLVNPAGMSILIRRWGKKGTAGELKVERFAIQKFAENEFEKIVKSKIGKGYETRSHDIKQIADEKALRMAVGPAVWPRIPGPDVEHILPDLDTTGRPQQLNPPRYSETGKYLGEAPPRVFSQTEIRAAQAAQKLEEQEVAAKEYAANPNFGRF